MDETTKAKLTQNIRNLPKMAVMWVATVVSGMATYFLGLPAAEQQQVLAALPIHPALLPLLAALLPIAVARVWPQKSLAQKPDGPVMGLDLR